MAIPLWIPIALAAASTVANMQAQRKVDDASARALRRNQARNDAETEKADAAALSTREAYTDQTTAMEDRGRELADEFKSEQEDIALSTAPSAVRPGESTDTVIDSETNRRQGTRRYTNQLGDALGAMRGVDQAYLDSSLVARNNLTDIRQAGKNMAGNNRILDYDMNAASQEGKGYGTLGDVLSMASMVTGIGAMSAPAAGTEAASVVGPDFLSMSPKILQPDWAKAAMSAKPGIGAPLV